MSYVDAMLDRRSNRIHIVERIDGKRVYQDYPASYVFYHDDVKGKFRTIFGTPVTRYQTHNFKEFQSEMKVMSHKKLWESDINPIFRCLEENYLGKHSPKLQTAFLDIEVGFDQERGFSSPEDPFNPVTAVSVYLDWLDKMVSLVLRPNSYSNDTAQEICGRFDNCFLFDNEQDLLDNLLNLIDDADIVTGWNSEGYDIPYLVMRTTRVLSKDDIRRFCLWGQYPKERKFERFGAEQLTFDLIGRVHLDYMQLYRKYTYEERHSYSLDSIAEHELGETKTKYEGTLDQLYTKDFQKFIEYNRQDTMIIAKLDKKLRFLDLANELAHDNTVLLPTIMGAVAVTEQAIINEAHKRELIVPNRKPFGEDRGETQAAGAYVAYPKKGIHEYIGSVDINSLYPTTIRALNMGPETIIGQLRPVMTDRYIKEKMDKGDSFAAAWEGLFGSLEYQSVMAQEIGTEITIDWESGQKTEHSAADVWKLIFDSNQPWVLSANGTIFSVEKMGIIPLLLATWYKERKEMQKKKSEAIEAGDKELTAFWDKRQLVKKINLNSLYGAILNAGCRFFDHRIGQSTTLTGRVIAKHMDAKINELLTGEYDYVGETIIYGDTDSCYFSIWPIIKDEVAAGKMEWNRDLAIQLYDEIANQVNETWPAFMEQAFHCPRENGSLIKAGREIVASKGLYLTKKRYAVMLYDLDGKRLDVNGKPGKMKVTGLDLRRSDTPKVIQTFLSDILHDLLTGHDKKDIIKKIIDFKLKFAEAPAWEKGTPKRVNNLTNYVRKEKALGKANLPGHVRAAMNWNKLREMHDDKYSMKIVDGMKVIVCQLRDNPLEYTSVAYPTDVLHIPQWFKDLPFDDSTMEATIVDKKIENLLGVLGWDLARTTETKTNFNEFFVFKS